jgi:hypothetical protein
MFTIGNMMKAGANRRDASLWRRRSDCWRVVALGAVATIGAAALLGVPALAQGPDAATADPSAPAVTPSAALPRPAWPRRSLIAEPEISIPPRPTEPRAAKTYALFDAHCARCHQAGKTETPLAGGGLANILALDELVRDRALVHPGLPDASRLYDILVTRHAPLEVYGPAPETSEPQPEQIERVRAWLKDIPADAQSCRDRPTVSRFQIEEAMREAQVAAGETVSDVRFFSLAHLHNACANQDEMAAYRQALAKLMNSLSSAGRPAKLKALPPHGTVLSFRLSDFGWMPDLWERVERAYPHTLPQNVPFDIRSEARAPLPIVNGDWFASAAATAPLYYALLRIPDRLAALAAEQGIDLDQNIESGVARRAALRESAVTRANRLAERHSGRNGAFWLMYDFATSNGAQNVFDNPSGPKPAPHARTSFKPEQIRVAYTLANGLVAFALFDAGGKRIDGSLPGIEKPFKGGGTSRREPGTTAGADCMACHTLGLKSVNDEFRSYAEKPDSAVPKVVKNAVLPLYASESEMSLLLAGDTERYRMALSAAGVDPAARLRGEELVTALVARYRRPAPIEAAAAEAGLAPDDFRVQLVLSSEAAQPLARRLQHGVLPRSELDRLFHLMQGASKASTGNSSVAGSDVSMPGGFLRDVKTDIGLSLWLDTPKPRTGDIVTVKAEADTDCYLTIIGIDHQGVGTVLFPNEFEPDNRVRAGRVIAVPDDDSPYQMRYDSAASETILARCSSSPEPPIGIEHDFDVMKFTVLGNWENYIRDTLIAEAEMRRDPEKAERARRAKAEAAIRALGRRGRSRNPAAIETERASTGGIVGGTNIGSNDLRDGRAVLVIGGS